MTRRVSLRPRTHGIRVIMQSDACIRRRASDDADADDDADDDAFARSRTDRWTPSSRDDDDDARDETHGGDAIGFGINENKRAVVDVDGVGAVLLQEFMGDVYAVSNACPHMGLSMQGKTPLLSAKVGGECEITCPAHGSTFSMKDGTPRGEWCPKLPELPMVGKPFAGEPKGIPTYVVRVDETSGEIMVDA